MNMKQRMFSQDEYERKLDKIIDDIFEEAYKYWTWGELAKEAGLAYGTVSRLGDRITRLPRFQTILKLAHSVGWDLEIQKRVTLRKVKAA